ncbi:manganese catalase family protein, partial [Pseudomonas viridiflava]|uniref:manganese catalase family protein n=1 Tax=Pseudomonas viridiflava TaxID=33069 RepID=UPI00197E718F
GMPEFSRTYFNMSSGDASPRGPWNSEEYFDYVEEPRPAVDGGDGTASVVLSEDDEATLMIMKQRTQSDPSAEVPVTGAELGSGEMPGKLGSGNGQV